jgi:hypothetical protein
MTLDSILDLRPAPDFLKIDVEGAELEVLRGAKRLLGIGPTMLIEVGSEHSGEVAELLGPYGYRFFDAEDATFSECELPPYSTLASTSLQGFGR